jgi:hypothetical protein
MAKVLELMLYVAIDMSFVAALFAVIYWHYNRRERQTDEFVKRHYHL